MAFNLDHFAFTNGWRFKITDGDRRDDLSTPFTIEPGEQQEIHRLDLEDEDVFGGWLFGAVLTSTSSDIAVEAITDPPGPNNQRRSGIISASELITSGANEPRDTQTWVEQTNIGGTDFYSLWFNGFGGFGAPVRFPEFSRVIAHNTGNSTITVNAFNVRSILIHKPELFFRQLAAFQAAQGKISPERVDELDEDTISGLIDIMNEK